ncbi:hypothetical protein OG552_16535 [Streptomyces sp. NBC_01476]|uniref:hypothetical protein n=1 Tax=Streptomyces sp. NBC_01476 TaxID=2903881 RepID=UPI002E3295BC|nr:hypothetical protein [Streptomyces sp. NBC_01476]
MSSDLRPWLGTLAAPRIARLPPSAEPDDGNRWTTGRCWLWCGREQARVLWIGTGTAPGGVTAHLFACAACAQCLGDEILASQLSSDIGGNELHGYAHVGRPETARPLAPPNGRHRRRS